MGCTGHDQPPRLLVELGSQGSDLSEMTGSELGERIVPAGDAEIDECSGEPHRGAEVGGDGIGEGLIIEPKCSGVAMTTGRHPQDRQFRIGQMGPFR